MARFRMRRAICFDTSPLIWGVRGETARGQEHMAAKTQAYIQYLIENGYSIMVPSPVIAEYFVGATATEVHEAKIITRGFEHPMLDVPAAMLAADLERGGMVEQVHDEFGLPKQAIRIDAFIIAIAIVNHAEKIITHNIKEFVKLARGRIAVEDVPDIPEQGMMEFAE